MSMIGGWNYNDSDLGNMANELRGYTNLEELLKPHYTYCTPPLKEEYKPSFNDIRAFILALINGRSVTMVDLREHSDEIISTVSEVLKKIEKNCK